MEANTKELYSAETAPELMFGLLRARVLSSAICTAAELGVADHLANGPVHVSALASATGSHENSLYRLLRCLAAAGIFEETDKGRFSHTPLSETLRSSSTNSLRALAVMDGEEWFTRTVDGLTHSVRTGGSAFDQIHGMGWVEYLREHPESSAIFNAGMEASTVQLEGPVLDRYDLSWANTIADVGGGTGAFLASILERNPQARGILAELNEVAEPARRNLEQRGLSDRCEVVAIDMFDTIPFKADACVLKRVIHDWPDEQAIKILTNCRDIVAPAGRILVIEPVVTGLTSALMDVVLMAVGGRERTDEDFERLFSASGLNLSHIVPVTRFVSVVEGIPG
jgi:SAM-dependent methyltransferase